MIKLSSIKPVFALLLVCAGACGYSSAQTTVETYNIFLVRHAEKTGDGFDPALTVPGQARARFFARWLEDRHIHSIWSSDFTRTLETARPLAEKLNLEVSLYDPRQQELLLGSLRSKRENAFVVGHSNTIPQLAALLCECEVAGFDENEYETAFEVVTESGQSRISTIDLGELWSDR